MAVYEISGPLFFASAKQYAEVLIQMGVRNKVLIIRMRHVPFVDATGLYNLKDVVKSLLNSNTIIILSGVNNTVYEDCKKANIIDLVGNDNIFDSFDKAIERANRLK